MNTTTQLPDSLPSPLKTPAWLQQLQWIGNPVSYMETAARQHPDLFAASVVGFGGGLVFVNQPQAIQTILTNDRKTFSCPWLHKSHFDTPVGRVCGHYAGWRSTQTAATAFDATLSWRTDACLWANDR
jgi:cytochrome P450